jgi:hypothetical protein
MNLSIAAEDLTSEISTFNRHVSNLGEKYSGLLCSVQQPDWSGVAAAGADAAELSKVRLAVDVALDEVFRTREAWHAASRSDLQGS